MDKKKNQLWPGWETVRIIGRGSFGTVYEIQRKLFDDDEEPEKAALKVISIPQNDSDIEELYNDGYDEESVTSTFHAHLKSIVAEYSLMRKMNGSSNIVNCDDVQFVQHDDGIGWDIFIKMELLTPLVKALPTAITEEQVIRIATDMCGALELCQKYKIVHRDIKPQNIFVSENGDYKLGDFGIAKTVEKTMGGTKTGTYKYMAPEVYSNQPYNSTADIYSLGLVLYWLLNERRMPFMPLPPAKLTVGMDEASRRRRFAGEPIPAPKNGSDELKRIILKACAFDPKERYQTAREMREDLLRLSGQSVPMVPPAPVPDPEPIPVTDPDDTETVGPNFDPTVGDDTILEEQTVGPVFIPDKNREDSGKTGASGKKGNKKRKPRVWILLSVAAILISLIAAFVIGDKYSAPHLHGKNTLHQNLLFSRKTKDMIHSISILDTLEHAPKDSWDASQNRNGSVLAWTEPNATGGYDLYIAGEGGVSAPQDSSNLFSGFTNLKTVSFNNNFDTANVTIMSCMFLSCDNLTQLDLSSWDTSNVSSMYMMFNGCQSLTQLDLSNWDTSNVTNMAYMFYYCPSLRQLNLSNWNTSNVTNMAYMFYYCPSLRQLNLSNWNTSNVINMEWMFRGCENLKQLNLSSWDVSNVRRYNFFMNFGATYNGRPWEELFQ